MKVTYVSTLVQWEPIAHLEGLVPFVLAAGADVDVVVGTDALADRFEAFGARAHVIPVDDKRDLIGALRLWPAFGDTDIVHSQDRRAGLFARALGRAHGARVVHTVHGLPEDIAPGVGGVGARPTRPGISRRRRWWLESVYLRVEAALATLGVVVTPSHAMKRYLVDRGCDPIASRSCRRASRSIDAYRRPFEPRRRLGRSPTSNGGRASTPWCSPWPAWSVRSD
jgi:hypothetical protein